MKSETGLAPEELIFVGICDLAAQVRGKSVPARDFTDRARHGVGYTPANICLSVFGIIGSSPFGTTGDIVLMPDTSTEVCIPMGIPGDDGAPEHFCLADILTKDGDTWPYCPRSFLRRGLQRLEKTAGCRILASFEQEFVYSGVPSEPKRAYALTSFREQGNFGGRLMAALRAAGMTPESFLPEYGPRQYEITVAPAIGMRAADEAVILRELARSLAARAGQRAVFSPILAPEGIGNGTHIHLSLRGLAGDDPAGNHPGGNPVMHEPGRPYGLSVVGERFTAGILHHMPALAAITTPTVCSYYRLMPDRWAPTWANIGSQDRAAGLRICPGPASAFNVEYRVADASANPYLALGALIHAGVDGIENRLSLPMQPSMAFAAMTAEERRAAGMQPLPRTLAEALDNLRDTPAASKWFGSEFLDLFLNFKREEEQAVAGLDPQTICDRYAAVF
jgi:glutamine synthetase